MMVENVGPNSFRKEELSLFWWFLCERQSIWRRRMVERLPPPWTDDPVLHTERFTNVYRELDTGTRYAIEGILEHEAPKPDKIFNVMLYRLIGRVETHRAIGFQRLDSFSGSGDRLRRVLTGIRESDKSPFTAAYMVSAYTSMGSHDKIENVARLFERLHAGFPDLYRRVEASQSARQVHGVLASAYGFGDFLAYQVLVDLLYPLCVYQGQPLLPYSHDDWAKAGPGARRGIAMLLRDGERPSDLEVMRWLRDQQESEFQRLGLSFPYLTDERGEPVPLTLANIQNCLCEFHKYVKIRDGTGRGRRKFRGGG